MKTVRRATLAVLAVAALSLATTGASFAAHQNATKPKLTIHITQTAIVWGRVSVSPGGKTCSNATCTYSKIAKGKMVTLKETAVNTQTWPFAGWTINGKSDGKASSITFKLTKATKVTATYVIRTGSN